MPGDSLETSVISRPILDRSEVVRPTYEEEERVFMSDAYKNYMKMWNLRQEPLDILDGRTIQELWDRSVRDYSVINYEQSDPNDPAKAYVSTIARDKTDAFIFNISSELMFPSVSAQNSEQGIDRIMSKVSRILMEWAHINDGYPDETGMLKWGRYCHKLFVEGTVHVMDTVTEEGLYSELCPNEEIFIPNFWQPSIQLQPRVYRVKNNVTYEEAEAAFGDLEAFAGVQPGSQYWFYNNAEFKNWWQGTIEADKCQIIYIWENLTQKQLKEQKALGRVPKEAKTAKWHNVIINGVLMFPVDTISPYKDGYYPISVGRAFRFGKSEFYYGDSVPNKIRYDKEFLDGWKTLVRYKAKLNAMPPLLSNNPSFTDEEIYFPATVTATSEDVKLSRIEGVGEPVSQSDVLIMQMAEKEIESGTVSPQTSGQASQKAMTRGESVIIQDNAQKILSGIGLEVSHFAMARSLPLLSRLYQFLPKRTIKKICIPGQTLSDGSRGTYEIIFEKIPKMTDDQKLQESFNLRAGEMEARKSREPKETVKVNIEYARNLRFYVRPDVGFYQNNKELLEQQKFERSMNLLIQRPEINAQKLLRTYIQNNGLDEELLREEQPQGPQLPPGFSQSPVGQDQQGGQPPQGPAGQMPQAPTQLEQGMNANF